MHYTSNVREMFSLPTDIYRNENLMTFLNWYAKCFFNFYILIIHSSIINNVLCNLKLCIHVHSIHVEVSVSQISDLGLSFHFMSKKTGNYLVFFSEYFFSIFPKK